MAEKSPCECASFHSPKPLRYYEVGGVTVCPATKDIIDELHDRFDARGKISAIDLKGARAFQKDLATQTWAGKSAAPTSPPPGEEPAPEPVVSAQEEPDEDLVEPPELSAEDVFVPDEDPATVE